MGVRLSAAWAFIVAMLLPGNSSAAQSRLFGEQPSQTQPSRGRPIQFSGGQDSVSTNLNNLAPKQNSFDQLQRSLANTPEELPKLEDSSALAPVRPPSTRPQTDSKKVRDLLEKRKNWIFLDRDELLANPQEQQTMERLRGDKDLKDDDPLRLTPAERFFLNLNSDGSEKQPANRRDKRDDSDRRVGRDDRRLENDRSRDRTDRTDRTASDTGDVSLPDGLKEREVNLRTLLGSKEGTINMQSSPFGFGGLASPTFETKAFDAFGLGQQISPAELQAKKTRDEELRQYRELLGLPASPNAAIQEMLKAPSLLDDQKPKVVTAPAPAAAGVSSMPSFLPKGPDVQFGTVAGLPSLTDYSPKSPVLPAFGSSAPILENPAPVLPPPPTFTAPKRVF